MTPATTPPPSAERIDLQAAWDAIDSLPAIEFSDEEAAALTKALTPPHGRPSLPTQQEMNQTFYVDVCRAEDRLKEFVAATDKLLLSLPDHWHDDATVELRDLASDTDAILNPHMHSAYEVEQAAKRYGAGSVVPPQPNKEVQP